MQILHLFAPYNGPIYRTNLDRSYLKISINLSSISTADTCILGEAVLLFKFSIAYKTTICTRSSRTFLDHTCQTLEWWTYCDVNHFHDDLPAQMLMKGVRRTFTADFHQLIVSDGRQTPKNNQRFIVRAACGLHLNMPYMKIQHAFYTQIVHFYHGWATKEMQFSIESSYLKFSIKSSNISTAGTWLKL